jgi:hypothetical protein
MPLEVAWQISALLSKPLEYNRLQHPFYTLLPITHADSICEDAQGGWHATTPLSPTAHDFQMRLRNL